MAEPKRYEFVGGEMRERAPGWSGGMVFDHDYLALERERDQALSAHAAIVAELEASRAEFERLRRVEFEHAVLLGFMKDRAAAVIAARIASDDGYNPTDQHDDLYALRWSGGPVPEPEGDAWSMDYLPRGEKIVADILASLAEACGRKG